MIEVVVVDDHRLVRVGIAAALAEAGDITVVGEAADGNEALNLLATTCADVVLMDLSMPGTDGIAATTALLARDPSARVLVLTSFAESEQVRKALAAGAAGYVLKDCTPEELSAAVRSAAAGHTPIDPRVAGALLPGRETPARGLSDREVEVLRLTARGLANKQIARELGIAERTVKVHLGNVFRRIGVTDRTSAALWARDNLPG